MPYPDNPNTVSANDSSNETIQKQHHSDTGLHAGMVLKKRFALESILGQGGMGTIFKAKDLLKEEMEDRKPFVAIKVLHPKYQRNDNLVKALQRETRKSQELAHPNIVNVHDFDRDGCYVFMVMEYLEGQTLNASIEDNSLAQKSINDRWRLIEMIARGLAYAHLKKVIHHDIKPANIFVTKEGNVKVLDFGIAKAMRASPDDNNTVFDQFSPEALTPAYATGEMLRWERPDIRDDIFAMGCVAYEILTGRHPFNKIPALQAAERRLEPEVIRGLSKSRWKVLSAALRFQRQDRLGTVVAFLEVEGGQRNNRSRGKFFWGVAGLVVVLIVSLILFRDQLASHPVALPLTPLPPSLLSSAQQAKVDRLLEYADLHKSVGRIVEPLGSSALDAYMSILELDPVSAKALEGIAETIEYCNTEAPTLLEQGDLERAADMVKSCLMAKPDHRGLRQIERELQRRLELSRDKP